MSNQITDSIDAEIKTVSDRLDFLKEKKKEFQEYNNSLKGTVPSEQVADTIWEHMVDTKATDTFSANDVAKVIGMRTTDAFRGIQVLIQRKLMVDTTPQKRRYKVFTITTKGAKDLGIEPSPAEAKPKPKKPTTAMKAKRKQARKGERQAEIRRFLTHTETFTYDDLTKTFNITKGNAQQTLSNIQKNNGGHPIRKRIDGGRQGQTATYRSLLYKGSTPASSPSREVRIGDYGVESGRRKSSSGSLNR